MATQAPLPCPPFGFYPSHPYREGYQQQHFQNPYPANTVVYPGQPPPPVPFTLVSPHFASQHPRRSSGPFSHGFPGNGERPTFEALHSHGGSYAGSGSSDNSGWRRGCGSRGWSGSNFREVQYKGHFKCKPCDKVYKCQENYQLHVAAHHKCPSCDFEAAAKVVRDHQMIHSLPDFLQFTSKEEIAKWREERRKNFPTAENVSRKKKLEAERQQRGEIATTPLYRYVQKLIGQDDDGSKRWSKRGRGRGRGCFRGRRGSRYCRQERRKSENYEEPVYSRALNGNSETAGTTEKKEESICSEADKLTSGPVGEVGDGDTGVFHSKTKETLVGAIMADLAGQSSDHKEHTQSEENSEKSKDGQEKERALAVGGCGFGRGRKKRQRKELEGRRNTKRIKKTQIFNSLWEVPTSKPTLLEKLLGKEMRREQNVMLQCIRYVVSTDFLKRQSSELDNDTSNKPASIEQENSNKN